MRESQKSNPPSELIRGDVVFLKEDCFKKKRGLVVHVAIALGKGKLLHILNGCESRIENGYISAQ